ncbi:xylulokinase [Piscibacillus halophilus]|uniref:xylulokinase n=1 Tax=Piscibacillus halophilus TaxID=571933 RepID=UPI00158DFAF1|nr:xylulokinase [Piscibacillus halophilus]
MSYVIGVDLGTSAVKVLLVNEHGELIGEASCEYPLIQEKAGYSEQKPEDWVEGTKDALSKLVQQSIIPVEQIKGISFSGQMHGLVLLDDEDQVLRNAILWNDTRTTKQCEEIYEMVGKERYIRITKNLALEGFTLPKILWVKSNEPELLNQATTFLLPKDYLRYRMTGNIHMDYSDAAGTGLLDLNENQWSSEILRALNLSSKLCPDLVHSHEFVGYLNDEFANATGLSPETKVFAGGADNACGAIGSGILEEGKTMCSIGTSGVVLSYEGDSSTTYDGKAHFFNHGKEHAYYSMGVTLSAGHSLNWFKETFAKELSFDELLDGVDRVPIGSQGLLFTPYLVGERTPHADADIRGSFIGMDSSHQLKDFTRSVLEGITFSLNETIEMFRERGKTIDTVISIGGGAKNREWLQIQADIFNAKIVRLTSEQGPGMGAALLAGYGLGWYENLTEGASKLIEVKDEIKPILDNVEKYQQLFSIYQRIYENTHSINHQLVEFRK